jgi:hypothetical protein
MNEINNQQLFIDEVLRMIADSSIDINSENLEFGSSVQDSEDTVSTQNREKAQAIINSPEIKKAICRGWKGVSEGITEIARFVCDTIFKNFTTVFSTIGASVLIHTTTHVVSPAVAIAICYLILDRGGFEVFCT